MPMFCRDAKMSNLFAQGNSCNGSLHMTTVNIKVSSTAKGIEKCCYRSKANFVKMSPCCKTC